MGIYLQTCSTNSLLLSLLLRLPPPVLTDISHPMAAPLAAMEDHPTVAPLMAHPAQALAMAAMSVVTLALPTADTRDTRDLATLAPLVSVATTVAPGDPAATVAMMAMTLTTASTLAAPLPPSLAAMSRARIDIEANPTSMAPVIRTVQDTLRTPSTASVLTLMRSAARNPTATTTVRRPASVESVARRTKVASPRTDATMSRLLPISPISALMTAMTMVASTRTAPTTMTTRENSVPSEVSIRTASTTATDPVTSAPRVTSLASRTLASATTTATVDHTENLRSLTILTADMALVTPTAMETPPSTMVSALVNSRLRPISRLAARWNRNSSRRTTSNSRRVPRATVTTRTSSRLKSVARSRTATRSSASSSSSTRNPLNSVVMMRRNTPPRPRSRMLFTPPMVSVTLILRAMLATRHPSSRSPTVTSLATDNGEVKINKQSDF